MHRAKRCSPGEIEVLGDAVAFPSGVAGDPRSTED